VFQMSIDMDGFERLIEEVVERKLNERQQRSDTLTTPDGQLCYTFDQAAEKLGRGENRGHIVRDMWRRGEIETVMVGNRRCVLRTELIAFLQRQR